MQLLKQHGSLWLSGLFLLKAYFFPQTPDCQIATCKLRFVT